MEWIEIILENPTKNERNNKVALISLEHIAYVGKSRSSNDLVFCVNGIADDFYFEGGESRYTVNTSFPEIERAAELDIDGIYTTIKMCFDQMNKENKRKK